jgi:hypothetical protein
VYADSLADNSTMAAKVVGQLSEAFYQITDTNAQSSGYSSQHLHRDLIFGALDIADVIPRQISSFRELFLAQTSFDSPGADGFTEDFGYFAASRHNVIAKQEYELQIYQAYLVINLIFALTLKIASTILSKLRTGLL